MPNSKCCNQKIVNRPGPWAGRKEGELMREDQILVKRAKGGDMGAFAELVRNYQKPVMRIVIRMLKDKQSAEDVVQEAFVKAFRKLESFEGRASFKSWVCQIAINTGKNRMRRKRAEVVSLEATKIAIRARAERLLEENDLKSLLQREVDKLPERQKLALSLRVFEEMSFKEVAEVMDCPYDTAKANYRHALMKLRHQFESCQTLSLFKNYSQVKEEQMQLDGGSV